MKRLILIILFVLFVFPAAVHAAPIITSYDNTSISGSGFSNKPTNAPRVWDDFEDNDLVGWQFRDTGTSWEVTSMPGSRGSSSYTAHKKDELGLDSMFIRPTSQSSYYSSFWLWVAVEGDHRVSKKFFRAGSTDSNTNVIYSNPATSALYITVEMGPDGNAIDYVNGGWPSLLEGKWSFIEVVWKMPILGDTWDSATIYRDGIRTNHVPNERFEHVWHVNEEMTLRPYIAFGVWFKSTTGGIPGGWWFDDIYIDYTEARVMICEGNSWESRGHCENQIPTNWTDTSISYTQNQGSFTTETVYLYVVDENGDTSAPELITFSPPSGPTLSDSLPDEQQPADTNPVTIGATTSRASNCRYSHTPGTNYTSMTDFTNTGGAEHTTNVPGVNGESDTYYARCYNATDGTNESDFPISFSVADIPTSCSYDDFWVCDTEPDCTSVGREWWEDNCWTIIEPTDWVGPNVVLNGDFADWDNIIFGLPDYYGSYSDPNNIIDDADGCLLSTPGDHVYYEVQDQGVYRYVINITKEGEYVRAYNGGTPGTNDYFYTVGTKTGFMEYDTHNWLYFYGSGSIIKNLIMKVYEGESSSLTKSVPLIQ